MSRSEDDKANSYGLERDERKKAFFFFFKFLNCSSFYWVLSCLLRESGAKTAEVLDRSRNIHCFKRLVPKRLGSTKFEHGPNGRVTKDWRKHGKIGGKGGGDAFCSNEFT